MAAYPFAPEPWLDLSTGINPAPWNGPRASLEMLARLPDPARIAELEATAARAFGVADPARIVATAGAEAGLRWLPRALAAETVDIVSPTYSSHEAAWAANDAHVSCIDAASLQAATAAALLLVNPNNPDGRTVSRNEMAALVRSRASRGLWTIVDESFVETAPEFSVADLASDGLVVLRSFGKFYGLPGVRLGFVVAPPEIADRIRALQGEWPVGAEAITMGVGAYGDVSWRTRTEGELRQHAAALDGLLEQRGLHVVGGASLFRLVSTPAAAAIFERLCRAGILTRPFAERPDWLRFGLPRREDFARLDLALRDAVG